MHITLEAEIDKLLENVRSAETIETQKNIYFQTEALITGDIPTIWICNPQEAIALRKEVMGFKPSTDKRMPLMNVWLKKQQ